MYLIFSAGTYLNYVLIGAIFGVIFSAGTYLIFSAGQNNVFGLCIAAAKNF